MRRTGLVVFPFGCGLSCWVASGVFCGLSGPRPAAAAGTGCAAAALANWHSLVWRLGDAAAPPAPLPDDRPAIPPAQLLILSMPRPELLYAVPICTGTGAWCPGRPCSGPSPRRQRGVSAAAEADGNSGLLASNRTAPGAGTRPLTRPCLCASVFSSWDVLMNTMHIYARSPQKSKSYKPTRHEKRTGTRDNEAQSA